MSDVGDPLDTERKREELVALLIQRRVLADDKWIHAFRTVPRELFVPRYWRWNPSGERRLLDRSRPEQRAEWLAGVYSEDSLLLQLGENEIATSSSTAPELMALMLEALQIHDGNRVLEVGTGTGYSAALLCARLGSERVTTIDVDPGLVQAARDHLAAAGYAPTVVIGDGTAGHPPNAPYDRVIATCGVSSIPRAWIDQTSRGGLVLAPLLSGIARLEVAADGTARGRFLPTPAYFMPVRGSNRTKMSTEELIGVAAGRGTPEPTAVPPEIENDSFLFLVDLAIPGVEIFAKGSRLQCPRLVDPADGSWARVDQAADGGQMVEQGGPRRLWDRLQATHRQWLEMGRPEREGYVISVEADGAQWVSNDAAGRHQWPLPS